MRRYLALVSFSLTVVLASCGGSSPSIRSAPPSTMPPGPRARLHLRGASGSEGRASLAPAIYPLRSTKYVVDGPSADLGTSATVGRLVPRDVTESDVRRVAAALGLGAGSVVRTNNGFAVSGPDASLTVSLIGDDASVAFSRGGPMAGGGSAIGIAGAPGAATGSTLATTTTTTTTAPAATVPDPSAAETIAKSVLDQMGVLGAQQWTADVSTSGGVVVACPVGVPCPSAPPVVFDRTVTFDLVLDGVKVRGADWSVTVGAHGRIESVSGVWATEETVSSYPLRSTHDAFADLQAGKAHLVGPQPMMALGAPQIASPSPPAPTTPVVVHITGVGLGYATWDTFDGATAHVDVVPTYRFHARTTNDSATYDIEVLALDPAVFDIVNPPTSNAMPAPQPARAPATTPTP